MAKKPKVHPQNPQRDGDSSNDYKKEDTRKPTPSPGSLSVSLKFLSVQSNPPISLNQTQIPSLPIVINPSKMHREGYWHSEHVGHYYNDASVESKEDLKWNNGRHPIDRIIDTIEYHNPTCVSIEIRATRPRWTSIPVRGETHLARYLDDIPPDQHAPYKLWFDKIVNYAKHSPEDDHGRRRCIIGFQDLDFLFRLLGNEIDNCYRTAYLSVPQINFGTHSNPAGSIMYFLGWIRLCCKSLSNDGSIEIYDPDRGFWWLIKRTDYGACLTPAKRQKALAAFDAVVSRLWPCSDRCIQRFSPGVVADLLEAWTLLPTQDSCFMMRHVWTARRYWDPLDQMVERPKWM